MKRRDFLLGTIWGGLWGSIVTRFMGKKEEMPKVRRIILGGQRVGKSVYNPYPKADLRFGGQQRGKIPAYKFDGLVHWKGFKAVSGVSTFDSREVTCESCRGKLLQRCSLWFAEMSTIGHQGVFQFKYNHNHLLANMCVDPKKSYYIQDILEEAMDIKYKEIIKQQS